MLENRAGSRFEIGPLEYSKLVMLISFNDFYNFPYCMALTDDSDCMSNSLERSSGLGNEHGANK